MRILAASSVFVMTYLVSWLVMLMITGVPELMEQLVPWLLGTGAAWLFWQRTGQDGLTLPNLVLAWGAIGGFCGFIVGFLGPMILAPESNQGPLLGLFVTAPLGVVLAALSAWWWCK